MFVSSLETNPMFQTHNLKRDVLQSKYQAATIPVMRSSLQLTDCRRNKMMVPEK